MVLDPQPLLGGSWVGLGFRVLSGLASSLKLAIVIVTWLITGKGYLPARPTPTTMPPLHAFTTFLKQHPKTYLGTTDPKA